MSGQWRLLLAALRFGSHLPAAAFKGTGVAYPGAAARYFPVAGALVGALGGAVYWLGAQLWPTSIAVVLAMLATTAMSSRRRESADAGQPAGEPAPRGGGSALDGGGRAFGIVAFVFALLLKYNALMALSAAGLPFAAPANAALGLIMICGHAASFALAVSVMGVSSGSLSIALLIGFAPAAVLGIPGLVGLAGAVIGSLGFAAYLRFERSAGSRDALDMTRLLSEACFYLGALAAWSYV